MIINYFHNKKKFLSNTIENMCWYIKILPKTHFFIWCFKMNSNETLRAGKGQFRWVWPHGSTGDAQGTSASHSANGLRWVTTSPRAAVSAPISWRHQLYWSPRALLVWWLMFQDNGEHFPASPGCHSTAHLDLLGLQPCWGSWRHHLLTIPLSPLS